MATGALGLAIWLTEPWGPISPGTSWDGAKLGNWGFQVWQFGVSGYHRIVRMNCRTIFWSKPRAEWYLLLCQDQRLKPKHTLSYHRHEVHISTRKKTKPLQAVALNILQKGVLHLPSPPSSYSSLILHPASITVSTGILQIIDWLNLPFRPPVFISNG